MAFAGAQSVVRFEGFEVYPAQRRLVVGGADASVGARAFDVLLALIERSDRAVGVNELLEVVWPGLVVEENNLRVQIAGLRKLIGPGAITTIPGRGYRFTATPTSAPPEGRSAAAPASTAAAAPSPAAQAPTPAPADVAPAGPLQWLVGRDQQLKALVGAGGMGKTALARALVQHMRDAHADGVRMIELAALVDSSLVTQTAAEALGVPGNMGSQVQRLTAAIAAKRMLVVLDNCEQVIDGVAALAEAIHAAAPGVRLLATSQVPLKLAHEHVIRLGALALPDTDQLSAARGAGAVALFAARAAAADGRFALDERNIGAVIDICRRLDGIPLAIELAAARVALLGVQGVRTRLGERFRLLTKGSRLAPARQQTLRAALEWSHGLLSAEEQTVFRRLGVFRGSFGLSAVQRLVTDAALDEWAALDFALEHDVGLGISMAGALMSFWREHGHHAEALHRCQALLARLGAAPAPNLSRLYSTLGALPYELGDLDLARSYAQRGLDAARAEGSRIHEGKALSWLGIFAYTQGDTEGALQLWTQALAIARETGLRQSVGVELCNIGTLYNDRGDREQALQLFTEALETFRSTGFRWGVGMATESLGEVTYAGGDFEAAADYWRQSLAEHRAVRHQFRIVTSLQRLAIAELRLGRPGAARDCLVECLTLCETHGFEAYRASSLAVMARVAAAGGDSLRAARLFGAAEQILDELSMVMEAPAGTDHATALAAARKGVDAKLWRAAWKEGQALDPRAALALALEPLSAALHAPGALVKN
jgi:DNA-binding winged helix-turn-helix (wHTH) protein/tetratricopeptide (TPR) repeat protein